MKRVVNIEVTAEDIAAGVREDCFACPIASALLRATGAKRAFVDGGAVAVGDWEGFFPPSRMEVPITKEVSSFVHTFDVGDSVEPFSFDLELP